MLKLIRTMPAENPSFLQSYWAALVWAAFILLVCSLPGQDLPDFDFWAIDIEDKIGHLAVFGMLAFLIFYGSFKKGLLITKRKKVIVITILIGTFYGAFTEILQGLAFPSRYASLSDFLADTLGTALGTVFANFVLYKHGRSK